LAFFYSLESLFCVQRNLQGRHCVKRFATKQANPDNSGMKIGQAIRQMRERLELTQEQLALAAGFDAGNLSRIELGRQQPSLKRLISIAHALNVQVSDIALRAEALEQVSSPKRLSEPTQKSFYDAYLPSGLNPDQLEILQAVAETLLKQARK